MGEVTGYIRKKPEQFKLTQNAFILISRMRSEKKENIATYLHIKRIKKKKILPICGFELKTESNLCTPAKEAAPPGLAQPKKVLVSSLSSRIIYYVSHLEKPEKNHSGKLFHVL